MSDAPLQPKPGIGKGVLHPKASVGQFEHVRFVPSPALEPSLAHYWTVAWDRTGLEPFVQETLPYPTVHAVLERGRSAVTFPMRGRFRRVLEGRGRVLGAKFRPGMFVPRDRRDLAAYVGQRLPFAEVFGLTAQQMAALEDDVFDAADPREMARRYDAFLLAQQQPPDPEAVRVRAIVEAIEAESGLVRVADVAERDGVTPRVLQRWFRRYVGLPPKWVLRRYRLHEVAEALARGEPASTLAARLGFADQAHMIRDFRAVVGETPVSYARINR